MESLVNHSKDTFLYSKYFGIHMRTYVLLSASQLKCFDNRLAGTSVIGVLMEDRGSTRTSAMTRFLRQ